MKEFNTEIIKSDLEELESYLVLSINSEVNLATEVSSYLLGAGGKRIRPILSILIAKSHGYEGSEIIKLSSAIELLHSATLIHDDVVDQSDLRRGKKSIHNKWDNAHGVLVGDFIYSKAFQLMAELKNPEIISILSNSTNIISEGEVLQLSLKREDSLSEKDYFNIIGKKTAELFKASTQSASILAGKSKEDSLNDANFGYSLGMAFQVQDDLLDYVGNGSITGKKLGKDFEEGKFTLPLLKTMELVSNQGKIEINKLLLLRNKKNFKKLKVIIQESGAIDDIRAISNDFTDLCINELHKLPQSNYRQALINIVNDLRERSS
jgi:octaprenyl-diphosphate synthase